MGRGKFRLTNAQGKVRLINALGKCSYLKKFSWRKKYFLEPRAELRSWLKSANIHENQNSEPLHVVKWLILHFQNPQNWFHVKFEWYKNHEIYILWRNGCRIESEHIWPHVGKAKMRLRGGSLIWKIVNKHNNFS